MTPKTVDDFFKPDGYISQVKEGFKQREGQADLSQDIYNACTSGEHIIAEGPTGFGKSIGLLTGAILYAVEHNKRIVISTETNALLDQYVNVDLPVLQKAFALAGLNFTFAAAKGKGNYICCNKLAEVASGSLTNVSPVQRWASLQQLPSSGERASIPASITVRDKDWYEVAADEDCEKRGCPFYIDGAKRDGRTDCFAYAARAKFLSAQVVITNHTLLLIDRQQVTDESKFGPLIGPFDILIVDEGHTLAEKAQATWGYEFGPRTISGTMRGLKKMLTRAGIEVFGENYMDDWRIVEDAIFLPLAKYIGQTAPFARLDNADIAASHAASKDALAAMKALYKEISAESKLDSMRGEDAATAAKERLQRMFLALQSVYVEDASEAGEEDAMAGNWLSFIETHTNNNGSYLKLKVKPIEVGPLMHVKLFKTLSTVVVASATLRVQKSFRFIRKEIGMPSDSTNEFVGKTPFNFKEAVKGYFPDDLPFPPDRQSGDYRSVVREYNMACTERIVKLINYTGGGALVLFTSVQSMRDIYEMVRLQVPQECMCQGDDAKGVLIERMKSDVHSCLFATKSFFTGVDIAGEGLRLLIIMRAPFKIPSDPIFKARCDKLEAAGKQSFRELSLPLMLMDLQQGFGRLIRTESDTGVFALLDSRANSKGYGSDIKAALPKIGTLEL